MTMTTTAGGIVRFHCDDQGFKAWLRTHPEGFVVNDLRPHWSRYIPYLHRASCPTINCRPANGVAWTFIHPKLCASDPIGLVQMLGDNIVACQRCF